MSLAEEMQAKFIASADVDQLHSIYVSIFLQRETVRAVLVALKVVITSFLADALRAPHWTTTRSAVTVEHLCGEAQAASPTKASNKAFLLSLDLVCERN